MPRDITERRQNTVHAYGHGRVTSQRRRIASTAASMGAFTVEELAEHVSAIPQTPVGLATVYRAVKALADAGSLEKVGTRRGSDLYVWCMKEGHHHHVVCTSCGAVGDAPCPFGTGAEAPGGRGSNAGFKILTHEATFYGLCPRCARLENGD